MRTKAINEDINKKEDQNCINGNNLLLLFINIRSIKE